MNITARKRSEATEPHRTPETRGRTEEIDFSRYHVPYLAHRVALRYCSGMTSSASECITESRDEYGYICSYTHTRDEPTDTLLAATAMMADVAADLAVKEGKTYVVAASTAPSVTVFLLPFGHPMIVERGLSIIKQLLPDGRYIPGPKPRKH